MSDNESLQNSITLEKTPNESNKEDENNNDIKGTADMADMYVSAPAANEVAQTQLAETIDLTDMKHIKPENTQDLAKYLFDKFQELDRKIEEQKQPKKKRPPSEKQLQNLEKARARKKELDGKKKEMKQKIKIEEKKIIKKKVLEEEQNVKSEKYDANDDIDEISERKQASVKPVKSAFSEPFIENERAIRDSYVSNAKSIHDGVSKNPFENVRVATNRRKR